MEKNWLPTYSLQLVISFNALMNARIQLEENALELFTGSIGVKQYFVLAHTRFIIYFAVLLQYAFHGSEDGIYLKTKFDGSLYHLKSRNN